MIFTKPYQTLPKFTSGYQWLPLVTSGYQIFKVLQKHREKPIKSFLFKKLFTSGYQWLPVVTKTQKTKEKEPKRKIKIYYTGCRVKGCWFKGLWLEV